MPGSRVQHPLTFVAPSELYQRRAEFAYLIEQGAAPGAIVKVFNDCWRAMIERPLTADARRELRLLERYARVTGLGPDLKLIR